jgi:hypothetical protein
MFIVDHTRGVPARCCGCQLYYMVFVPTPTCLGLKGLVVVVVVFV